MKVQHSIDREIEVVEHLIEQLNQCLVIFKKSGNRKAYKETLNDLETCKKELQNLISKRISIQGEEMHGYKIQ